MSQSKLSFHKRSSSLNITPKFVPFKIERDSVGRLLSPKSRNAFKMTCPSLNKGVNHSQKSFSKKGKIPEYLSETYSAKDFLTALKTPPTVLKAQHPNLKAHFKTNFNSLEKYFKKKMFLKPHLKIKYLIKQAESRKQRLRDNQTKVYLYNNKIQNPELEDDTQQKASKGIKTRNLFPSFRSPSNKQAKEMHEYDKTVSKFWGRVVKPLKHRKSSNLDLVVRKRSMVSFFERGSRGLVQRDSEKKRRRNKSLASSQSIAKTKRISIKQKFLGQRRKGVQYNQLKIGGDHLTNKMKEDLLEEQQHVERLNFHVIDLQENEIKDFPLKLHNKNQSIGTWMKKKMQFYEHVLEDQIDML